MTESPEIRQCKVCMHKCSLSEGQTGFCGIRTIHNGVISPDNYGYITALALDPIEKKPIKNFHPGSYILSIGSYGCNLRCPFCQNHDISQAKREDTNARKTTPEQLCEIVKNEDASIGLAYTYNEPLIGYEFVRDCAKLIHEVGKYNVLVSNGEASLEVLGELLPYMDAMNIDLKGFRDEIYASYSGDLALVKDFIKNAAPSCHVEVTSLIVPGMNDSEEDMDAQARWLASVDPDIPLHITRYFPQYKMRDRAPTSIPLMYSLADIASKYLRHVYLGNI